MINKIVKLVFVCLLFLAVLGVGGYSIDTFSQEIHLKNPTTVLSPLFNQLPTIDIGIDSPNNSTTTDNESEDNLNNNDSSINDTTNNENSSIDNESNTSSGNHFIDENGNFIKHDITLDLDSESDISQVKSITIKLDDKEIKITSDSVVDFIEWLHTNYSKLSKVEVEIEKHPDNITTDDLSYDNVLANKTDLNNLVSTIPVVDTLLDGEDYDRDAYERPVKSYEIDGKKYNRNDYAWKTSQWFDEETYTYMCPYTGTIIHDLDDNKEDLDFGNLDFDHIVPLRSTFIRGAKDWSEEKKNEFSYNPWIGVDVLNSANRSKSDKGPCEYMPDINQEDYCYSWLMICSYYQLNMTVEEIDLCVSTIELAIDNGETVEFLGGSREISK